MRSCIFCNGRASTIEDAWPLWLVGLLGRIPPGRMEAERAGQETRIWKAEKPELRVKNVCDHCNNGWMSDLENRVKPIIKALFTKESVTLDSYDQTTLTVWSLKTAMVYETLRSNQPWFFDEAERRELMDTLKPIQHTSVWIAKYMGGWTTFCTARDHKGNVIESDDPVKAYITTMCFGPLALQVFNSKFPISIPSGTHITYNFRPGPWDSGTLQIWPSQKEPVIWPASVGLSGEDELMAFSERCRPISTHE